MILQNAIKHVETETQNGQRSLHPEQIAPLENLHLLSNFTQAGETSLTRINLQPSNHFNSSLNADDSVFLNNADDQIIEQRHQNTASVVIRPRGRKVRRY